MTTTTADPIARIQSHARKIAAGEHETVRPGLPYRISEATDVGEGVWQGDLGIEVVAPDFMPEGYVRVDKPKAVNRQLVPGNTSGARHCLDSLKGVEIYRPREWPAVTQLGPLLRLKAERTIEHPKHGAVTIPAGFAVLCSYQREWDSEQRRERRNAD